MCDSLVVPRSHHALHKDLPCYSSVKDRLTEENMTEEQDDKDEDENMMLLQTYHSHLEITKPDCFFCVCFFFTSDRMSMA